MRRTPGKASEFAAKVPVKEGQPSCVGYDNLDDFLKHPGLEAVYVSTRPGTHSEIAKKVAEAGLACYVEKPVGRCAAETIEMTEAFGAKGLPLYTAYISRAYERTQAARKLIKDGKIGDKLVGVTYTLRGTGGARDMNQDLPWRLDAIQSGGGLIMDVGCHVLDRIDYLCGPLEQVQGSSEHRQPATGGVEILVENYCRATAVTGPAPWASMPNGGCEGAKIDLTWDFSITDENESMDELVFVGSNGKSLKMAGMSPNGPIQVLDQDGVTVLETRSFDMPQHTGRRLIQAVTDDLIDRKKESQKERSDVLSFGDNAIRTQQVIDTMLEKYYGGREIGYWSRANSWPGSPAVSSQKS
jgi:predicted dehydrogenase